MRVGVALLLGAVLVSCDAPEAGEGRAPAETPIADLTLELSFGDDPNAPPDYQFSSIRSIVASQNGTIWVADGGRDIVRGTTPRLRQFDPEGRLLRHVGQEGDGPGEYRWPDALVMLEDGRVALRDHVIPDRITLYDPDGAVDTTWSLGGRYGWVAGGPEPVQDDSGVLWLPFQGGRPGPDRPSPLYLRLRTDGTVLDTVPFPRIPEVERERLRIVRNQGMSVRGFSLPYQPSGAWSLGPHGRFAVARTDRYRIEVLPPPGAATDASTEVITRTVAPVPVAEAERAQHRERLERELAEEEGGEGLSVPPLAEVKPPIRGVSYASDGRLWVAVSMPSVFEDGEWSEPRAYDLFDEDGSFLARVEVPDSFSMRYRNGDYVWGVHRGAYDIESVRRYRIEWPDSF